MTPGELTSYATYTFLLGAGAAGVAKGRGEWRDGIIASEEVWKIIDEGKGARGVTREIVEVDGGSVEVSGLDYVYKGGKERVLKGLEFTIGEGEVVAITGRNGCGKSTVAMVLKGLYHRGVTGGNVRVGGKKVGGGGVIKGVNVVMQQVGVLEGTVFDNVMYGREELGREEVRGRERRLERSDSILSI